MMFRWIHFWLILSVVLGQPGMAYESEKNPFGYLESPEIEIHQSPFLEFQDTNRIEKFETALQTLGIPLESAPDFTGFVQANETNLEELKKNLPFLDPDLALFRYLDFSKGAIQLFRDFFNAFSNPEFLEFKQTLSTFESSKDSEDLMVRLATISNQVRTQSNLPLKGLKVLVDPGHMGGQEWDHRTGKYVEVNGKRVSEGNITLWTSLLLTDQLEKLGAEVLLTRDDIGTVSQEPFESFDHQPYLNAYFQNSMDDWMAAYLQKPMDVLLKTIRNAPEVRNAYSETQRARYYITGADLEARSVMIDQFKPDLSIIVHFDASKSNETQNRVQSLEAFIPGAFGRNETGGRKAKAMALKHLLEVRKWNQTVEFSDQVTQAMSESLQIPRLSIPKAFSGVRVRDGVYTRNLYLNRRLSHGLITYLECLHYDHVQEHSRLAELDAVGNLRGKSFAYPSRLKDVAVGITDGVLRYFEKFKN